MEAAGSRVKKVLVVCTGNSCRSPMAEGWLNRHLAGTGWTAESAGVAAWNGMPATPEAIQAMREIGIDISAHRSRKITAEMAVQAEVILAMTEGHRREIAFWFPVAKEKTFLLNSFGPGKPRDVADPVGLPVEAYRHTRDELAQALGDFLLHLVERGELKKDR
jgi:protein-tyrosine-phosphatase